MNAPDFEPLKVPAKGFVVFGKAQPWKLNACLHFSYNMQYAYEKGYKKAAEILIEYVAAHDRHQDILVYPIVFLLRQRLELQLKSILKLLVEVDKRQAGVPMIHDLSKLWSECKGPLMNLISPEDRKWLSPVEDLMKQITDVDPNSDAFRFATATDGTKSASNLQHINLIQLYESIEPLTLWLDGVVSYLSEISSFYSEQRSEYQ
jgi:hypothetical protein